MYYFLTIIVLLIGLQLFLFLKNMKHEKKKDKTFSQKEPVTKSSHNKERKSTR